MMEPSSLGLPLRHISIRVPWHDGGWTGTVCNAPLLNGACAKLKRISAGKNDEAEMLIAGRSFEQLPAEQRPCCVEERVAFMAPFEMVQVKKHALAAKNPDQYGHFRPTPQRYPAYSAGIVPFRWMMREDVEKYRDLYNLDVDESREPDLGYRTEWVHEIQNQTALLNGFAGQLRNDESLCFVYAKHVPFVEGTGRILIGVGRLKAKGILQEYRCEGEGMRGMIWERPIQHSIRPKGGEGFLFPYYDLLKRAEEDPTLDLERYTAKAPDEHWDEFSYASELVTPDGAISALLSIETTLDRLERELGIPTGEQRKWIGGELVTLWKVRGPIPGLGAVLAAFGLSRGIFIAHALQEKAGQNADPWPLVDSAFNTPASVLPKDLHDDLQQLAPTWTKLPKERKAFLRLLSRFELTKDQAAALYDEDSRRGLGWDITDSKIIGNPYRIYEVTRHNPRGVPLLIVDRGVFPEDVVRLQHPLEVPSRLDSGIDLRRVRAFAITALEEAAADGHTLLPKGEIVNAIQSRTVRPACSVTGDILATRAADMAPEIVPAPLDGDLALQLDRYQSVGELVRKQVNGRMRAARHAISVDWIAEVNDKFGALPINEKKRAEEQRARSEKAAALKEIAESRFSVVVGPAGTGKTTLLGILCAQPAIRGGGILLLAPTGKARVRMQELAEIGGGKALTIAQFLNQYGRYDPSCGRYIMCDRPRATGFATAIVDESSMLTEDMLGALFNTVQGVKRYIFVGDPAQLPPIGAGRPFADIVAKLRPAECDTRFPRVGPGYAELTIGCRQTGGNDRPDLQLARWFGAMSPSAGDDDIFSVAKDHENLLFIEWGTPDDFQKKFIEVLAKELKLDGSDPVRLFNQKLGAASNGDYDYFNASWNGKKGAVEAIEDWQILSPLRGMPFGVGDINRQVHERFRDDFLALAGRQWRPIPKPLGAERIVYGDKVINLKNHRRDGKKVYPQEGAFGYVANGEIGIVVGQWKTGKNPKILKVEFSSQKQFTYDFYASDFREEGDPALELAYALTVHKAQGSQFRLVILVLPQGHPILSRELVYTALTRHQHRVVIMHQGPRTTLKELSAPQRSETARRMTNLLQPCKMVEFPEAKRSIFLQDGLIHRTSTGLAVRSKSEVIIADALSHAGIQFEYEKPLTFDGMTKYPDFTIEDDISGRIVYWEHLGLLDRPEYQRSWEKKLHWYRSHGILTANEGTGTHGTLITTSESDTVGFDSSAVHKIIEKSFNG